MSSEMLGSSGTGDLQTADIGRLDDVIDRSALADVCRSIFDLFGISIRIVTIEGRLLADSHGDQAVCRYVNKTIKGRSACTRIVERVRTLPVIVDPCDEPCFTGANYRVIPIVHDGRTLGRVIVGPYMPAETTDVPLSLLTIDPAINPEEARVTLSAMPRVKKATAVALTDHVLLVLEAVLHVGVKMWLTNEMHLASVRESYRELTERNAQLEEALARSRELDRLKSNFLSTVSHELKTPLTSILGYSDMLRSGVAGQLAPEQLEFVETIRSKGELLLRLIQSLLDLGKLEQGQVKLELESVDVAALLHDIRKTLTPVATKRDVGIDVDVTHVGGPIRADSVRLRQILTNLIENATKFSKKGGRVVVTARDVEITLGDEGIGAALFGDVKRGVEIKITDQGIGMPAAELPRIFDAFYQVDGGATREHGGAGLGLAIVKRLVDAHGGTIGVESELGRGTTFTVTIPDAAD